MTTKSIVIAILSFIVFVLLLRTLVELGWSYWGRHYKHKYEIALLFSIAALLSVITLWH